MMRCDDGCCVVRTGQRCVRVRCAGLCVNMLFLSADAQAAVDGRWQKRGSSTHKCRASRESGWLHAWLAAYSQVAGSQVALMQIADQTLGDPTTTRGRSCGTGSGGRALRRLQMLLCYSKESFGQLGNRYQKGKPGCKMEQTTKEDGRGRGARRHLGDRGRVFLEMRF